MERASSVPRLDAQSSTMVLLSLSRLVGQTMEGHKQARMARVLPHLDLRSLQMVVGLVQGARMLMADQYPYRRERLRPRNLRGPSAEGLLLRSMSRQ